MPQKRCFHCGIYKNEQEFNWRFKFLAVRNKACKPCRHAFNKAYHEEDAKERHLKQVRARTELARKTAREFVYQYPLTHPSEICGESDPRILEFHHVGAKEMG